MSIAEMAEVLSAKELEKVLADTYFQVVFEISES
jgi:hypothetical protein